MLMHLIAVAVWMATIGLVGIDIPKVRSSEIGESGFSFFSEDIDVSNVSLNLDVPLRGATSVVIDVFFKLAGGENNRFRTVRKRNVKGHFFVNENNLDPLILVLAQESNFNIESIDKGGRLTPIADNELYVVKLFVSLYKRFDFDVGNVNISPDLRFCAFPINYLRFQCNAIALPHRFGRFTSILHGLECGVQRALNKPYPQRGYGHSYGGENKKPEGPAGHVLLGVQVLAGIGLLLSGLYGFGRTLGRSRTLTPGAGAQIVLLYVFVMLAGGYLIASTAYP